MPETIRSTRRLLAPVLAAAALLLSACGGGSEASTAQLSAQVVDPPFDVSSTPLTDTEGEPFSLTDDTDARLTLVFFGYTRCPDICPAVLTNLASAMTRLDEADREQVEVVFVTSDPARDDAKTVRSYLDRIDPDFIGLTGDIDDIEEVGESIAIGVTDGTRLPSGGYDPNTHSTQVVAIDGGDDAPLYWGQETSSAQFAADIHALLERG